MRRPERQLHAVSRPQHRVGPAFCSWRRINPSGFWRLFSIAEMSAHACRMPVPPWFSPDLLPAQVGWPEGFLELLVSWRRSTMARMIACPSNFLIEHLVRPNPTCFLVNQGECVECHRSDIPWSSSWSEESFHSSPVFLSFLPCNSASNFYFLFMIKEEETAHPTINPHCHLRIARAGVS